MEVGEEIAEVGQRWGARFLATEGLGHTRILWDESVVAATTAFLAKERAGTQAEPAAVAVSA